MKFSAFFTLLPLSGIALACNCVHNGDAGRWRDSLSPADRIGDLCSKGGGCHQGEAGRMCVLGDMGQCNCAVESANAWQSWHGDWFRWSAVNCGSLSITIT